MNYAVSRLPTWKEFQINMEQKRRSTEFTGDMQGLLNPTLEYDQEKAFEWLFHALLQKMA